MPRKMSLKTIQARIVELQKKAEALESKARPEVEKVVALIKKHGLTFDDVKEAFKSKRGRKLKLGKDTKSTKRISKIKGKKVPVKYKDEKGNKWSGRGFAPKWITEAEKAGKDRSQFAVR